MITIENIREKIAQNDYPTIFRKAKLDEYADAAQELTIFVKSMVEQGVFEEFAKAPDTRPILQEQIDGLNNALTALEKGNTEGKSQKKSDDTEAPHKLHDITAETRLADILAEYPELKMKMAEINPKFKMLQTPLARVMIPKATISMMSNRSGMPVEDLIIAIKEKIGMQ